MAISYQDVPKSSRLFLDYLYDSNRVSVFFSGSPFHLSSYQALAERAQGFDDSREELTRILSRQNESFGSPPAVFKNIERLRQQGNYAVVTGQQVGLFSGPAFTLYKALTAVRIAQWLSEQGLPSVPVFWLATEDHDFDEVAQAAFLDEEYQLVSLADPGERPGPRAPVGAVKLTSGVSETLNRLETMLPPGDARDKVMVDIRDAYRPGNTWSQSFGRLMARLFGRWGVILVDSLDGELHQLSARAYGIAIEQSAASRRGLLERSQTLVRCGYHAQVHVAEDSTLLFLMSGGERLPLRQTQDGYIVGEDQKISLAQLKTLLAKDPLQFSGNVLMRPIIQDSLLPTLAYVAGPSELAYLGQAQAIYQAFGRPMPVVFPRAGFTLIDRKAQRVLDKYQIAVEDVWQGEEHLSQKLAAASFAEGWAERFDQSERELAALLGRLAKDIETLDPTLLDTLKHAEEKMKYQLEKLRGKLSRAALQRSESLSRHQHLLKQLLFPAKDLQERQVCGLYFLARAGYDLLDRILDEIQVGSSEHQILQY
jgi:bacillithiol biosynthesis cysteine-adding enzyme BshC